MSPNQYYAFVVSEYRGLNMLFGILPPNHILIIKAPIVPSKLGKHNCKPFVCFCCRWVAQSTLNTPPANELRSCSVILDSERGNFKLFGVIYLLYLKKFEHFGARLLKNRVIKRP